MSLARLLFPTALLVALPLTLPFASVPVAMAQPATPAAGCQPSQGSLSFIGCSLAQQLALPPGGASVTVVSLKSDRELPTARPAARARAKRRGRSPATARR